MSKQVTITSLNGMGPYIVYLCDNTYSGCVYIDSINNSSIPYSFLVPTLFASLPQVGVKVVDSNGCVVQNTVNI